MSHSNIDYYAAGLSVVGALVIFQRIIHTAPFDSISTDTRHSLYQVGMTVSVTMAGFTLTTVSVLLSMLRTPLSKLDALLSSGQKRVIGDAFLLGLPALASIFAVSMAGFIWDSAAAANVPLPPARAWVEYAAIFSVIIAVLRYGRIFAVLKLMLPVAT